MKKIVFPKHKMDLENYIEFNNALIYFYSILFKYHRFYIIICIYILLY